jgi:ankyrin repeat protein
MAVVCQLLGSKVNVNAAKENGGAALIFAVQFGHASVVEKLISYGTSIDLHNKMGKTALDYAMEQGRQDLIRILLPSPVAVDGKALVPSPPVIITLDLVKTLSRKMYEEKGMSDHICSRLELLKTGLDTVDGPDTETCQRAYEAILQRLHTFLVQYGDRCLITRIVSGRSVFTHTRGAHEQAISRRPRLVRLGVPRNVARNNHRSQVCVSE